MDAVFPTETKEESEIGHWNSQGSHSLPGKGSMASWSVRSARFTWQRYEKVTSAPFPKNPGKLRDNPQCQSKLSLSVCAAFWSDIATKQIRRRTINLNHLKTFQGVNFRKIGSHFCRSVS